MDDEGVVEEMEEKGRLDWDIDVSFFYIVYLISKRFDVRLRREGRRIFMNMTSDYIQALFRYMIVVVIIRVQA